MLFASWLYKDDELRDGKKLFPFVFSFSKMMLSFSKRMVSFRKVHWVFFLSLELRSSFEKKNSMDFPSGHHPFASGQHHFASGENNCKKFFAIPQYPHPYIIFWQIKTPDFIFQLLSIISHPFGFILQQTPIQNYILAMVQHGAGYRYDISKGTQFPSLSSNLSRLLQLPCFMEADIG